MLKTVELFTSILAARKGVNRSKHIGIGYTTTTTIKQRMTTHAQNGSITNHNIQELGIRIWTADIMKDIKILYRSNEKMDLVYAETLQIKHEQNSRREGECTLLKVF